MLRYSKPCLTTNTVTAFGSPGWSASVLQLLQKQHKACRLGAAQGPLQSLAKHYTKPNHTTQTPHTTPCTPHTAAVHLVKGLVQALRHCLGHPGMPVRE